MKRKYSKKENITSKYNNISENIDHFILKLNRITITSGSIIKYKTGKVLRHNFPT
jgi:hypothetical protein